MEKGGSAKSYGKAVTRYDFSSPFAEAWYATMTAKNIQVGFKISGVFPFNKHPFELPAEKYRSFNPEEVVKKSKLKYILLYSPTPCRRRHNLSDETTVENSCTQTSGRRSYSESSLYVIFLFLALKKIVDHLLQT